MKVTQQEYDEWLRNNPSLAQRNPQADTGRICASKPECTERETLERAAKRKAKSIQSSTRSDSKGSRYRIHFRIWSVRPADYDNYAQGTKQVQDVLVEAGIIPDDAYDVLEGTIASYKCAQGEERTEILIEQIS